MQKSTVNQLKSISNNMQVYEKIKYEFQEKEPLQINILEFITEQQASGIWLVKPAPHVKKGFDTELTVVNYGIPRANTSNKPIRGIQQENDIYLIDIDGKTLTKKEKRNLRYDVEKIRTRVVFEGTIEDILTEFESKNFRIQ